MKKNLFVSLAVLSGILVACKGDFDCECTNSAGDTEVAATYNDVKKSDAKESCKAMEELASTFDPGVSCSIKKK